MERVAALRYGENPDQRAAFYADGAESEYREADKLATEVRTLGKLLGVGASDLWPPLVDAVKVAPGYEAALAAALGYSRAAIDICLRCGRRHALHHPPAAQLPGR